VGDSGVYLMSNGDPPLLHNGKTAKVSNAKGIPRLTAHAEGSDWMDEVDNWWPTAGAVTYLNEDARQGRGEASAVARNDGSVELFFLEPGSLGAGNQQAWVFRNFTAAEGTAGAVTFLNDPARQGPGEASAFARNDGSVALFYLEPGTG
jgi:hypothetical protein